MVGIGAGLAAPRPRGTGFHSASTQIGRRGGRQSGWGESRPYFAFSVLSGWMPSKYLRMNSRYPAGMSCCSIVSSAARFSAA